MIQALLPLLGTIIEKVLPDKAASEAAKVKLAELNSNGQLSELSVLAEVAKAQLDVNKAEAQSDGWYKGGWRPAIGYVLAICLAYQFLFNPILVWGCAIWAADIVPPQLGLNDNLWELMFGMLGLAGWRTLDKRQGSRQ